MTSRSGSADTPRCPGCGKPYAPAPGMGGACPTCLLHLALDAAEPSDDDAAVNEPSTVAGLGHGDRIGPYRIIRRLTEDRNGTAYLAEQTTSLRRQVAIRVTRRPVVGDEAVTRFEVEREALAAADHPAIGRILDAGKTDDDRVYFVTDFVDGVPVTTYCNAQQLALQPRLELFARVCDGLQQAHRHGVLHRGLRPSSVLIATSQGAAQPKIVDFGVARAVRHAAEPDPRDDEPSPRGPLYRSPEQLDRPPRPDTRSDVYLLGIVLYELLTGAFPLPAEAVGAYVSRGEAASRLRRTRLQPPGLRLRQRAPGDPAPPAGLSPRAISRDLDRVALKALEPEPDARYESPAALADDVRRVLSGRSLSVGPGSLLSDVPRFARRRPIAALTIALPWGIGLLATIGWLLRALGAIH